MTDAGAEARAVAVPACAGENSAPGGTSNPGEALGSEGVVRLGYCSDHEGTAAAPVALSLNHYNRQVAAPAQGADGRSMVLLGPSVRSVGAPDVECSY